MENVAMNVAAIQGEDMDTKSEEKKIHIIVLTVLETIIYHISTGANLVNLSGLRLLILHLHSLQQLFSPLLLLLCRSPEQIMIISFIFKLLSRVSQLIVPCMGLFHVSVHFLLPLISLEF